MNFHGSNNKREKNGKQKKPTEKSRQQIRQYSLYK